MSLRSKAILTKARRLSGAERPVIMIVGNPDVGRLQWLGKISADAMVSERECLIGEEVFEAEPDETIKAFHARMCRTARERSVWVISLGFEPPAPAPAYPAARTPAPIGTVH